MPGGGPGLPGGSGSQQEGSQQEGPESDPTWETTQGGGSDGGWQTSNELPGGSGSPGGTGEESGAEGNAGGGGDDPMGGGGSLPSQSAGDAELEGALKDFDGEILAERDIIKESADANPGGAGGSETDEGSESGSSEGEGSAGGTIAGPVRRPIPAAPAPPRKGAEGVPDDIPDARDDDIIARQLREAAMQEDDPVLKEKLWEEYRKYKKG